MKDNLYGINRVRFYDYSNYDSENVTMAVIMAFGLIVIALKMVTGESVTEQQQTSNIVLYVVTLMTIMKEMIVAMNLVTVVENMKL